MMTAGKEKGAAIEVVRWSARVLALIMASFLLLMFFWVRLGRAYSTIRLIGAVCGNQISADVDLSIGYVLGGQMGAGRLFPWSDHSRRPFHNNVPEIALRICFWRLQRQRGPESSLSCLMATDPFVPALLRT
jgi:hypothetical protein